MYNRNQIGPIAQKILNKCNYNHIKSKNNNTALRTGNGKLMMTNGLTIADFERRYNL